MESFLFVFVSFRGWFGFRTPLRAAVHNGHVIDLLGQFRVGLTGQQTPLPVALRDPGDVHAVVLAQPQIVLHLCHEQISHTALSDRKSVV